LILSESPSLIIAEWVRGRQCLCYVINK